MILALTETRPRRLIPHLETVMTRPCDCGYEFPAGQRCWTFGDVPGEILRICPRCGEQMEFVVERQ